MELLGLDGSQSTNNNLCGADLIGIDTTETYGVIQNAGTVQGAIKELDTALQNIDECVPMTGTSIGDPIVGPLVWKDGSYVGTANQHGMVLTDTRSGASILGREGLDIVVGDLEGDYRNYQAKLINTQNDFPGYPDFAELTTRALTLNEETSQNGTRVEKQIDIRPSTTAAGENKITSKGHLNIATYPGGNLSLSGNILSIGAASSIELVPPNSSNVIITNGGGITTNKLAIGTSLNNKEVSDIWTSTSTGTPTDSQLITAKAALEAAGGSVSTTGGVQGDGTALYPVTLKLDATGNVTLTQGPDGLKADYSPNDEDAEYYSYPFTMSTHLLSRPLEMLLVPIYIDWSSNIRSVKFYNGTLGGATTPYMVVLYHSIGDINTAGSYLEPFAYYYKSDGASDIVKGWNKKPLTFRGASDTWDETEYLATNGEEIFVGFWSRDTIGVPYIEGYADKAMGCNYTAWSSIPILSTVKNDIQVASVYAVADHIHIALTSETVV